MQLTDDLRHIDSNWYCWDCYMKASGLAHSKLHGYSYFLSDDWASVYLPDEDIARLVGKRSGGLCIEYGRCTYCGHLYPNSPIITFFCSESCERKAYRPYLPGDWDWDANIDDDEEYAVARGGASEIQSMTDGEFRQLARESGYVKSRAEALESGWEIVEEKRKEWENYRTAAMFDAKRAYEKRWFGERDNILKRAWEKERVEMDEQLAKEAARTEKERAKEAERLQREQAIEAERLAEDEKWRPRPFNV
jgi:hypothetical protein